MRLALSALVAMQYVLIRAACAQPGGGLQELELLAPTKPASVAAPLPLTAFLPRPEMRDPELSPNGRHVAAALRNAQGHYALAIFDVTAPSAQPLVISTEATGELDRIWWLDDSRLLFRVRTMRNLIGIGGTAPFPNFQMFAINVDGSNLQTIELSAPGGLGVTMQFEFAGSVAGDTDRALFAYREAGSQEQALFNANVQTGSRIKDTGRAFDTGALGSTSSSRSAGSHDLYDIIGASAVNVSAPAAIDHWYLDGAGRPRIGRGVADVVESVYYRGANAGAWATLMSQRVDGGKIFEPLAFDPTDPDVFYVISNHEAALGLYRYRGSEQRFLEQLLEMPGTPPFITATYDARRTLEGVRFGPDANQMFWLDAALERAVEQAHSKLPGWRVDVASANADESRLLLFAQASEQPGRYYLYEPASGELRYFGRTYPQINPPLSETRAVSLQASDGAKITAYLNLPAGASSPPAAPLPTVVMPHGEAEARDYSAFDPFVQLLTNRGYAVLQVSYQRTPRYFPAAYAAWHLQDRDDVEDAAAWLVAQKIADPEKTCVLGNGAGGYAALLAAQQHPQRYACAVSRDGFASPAAMRNYYKLLANTNASLAMLGDHSDAALDAHSPADHADDIEAPVLLVHSEQAAMPILQSETMDRALRRARVKHEFLKLDDDSRDSEIKYLTALEEFLDEHLH